MGVVDVLAEAVDDVARGCLLAVGKVAETVGHVVIPANSEPKASAVSHIP